MVEETQREGDSVIPTLRLPESLGATERERLLVRQIKDFQPDWVSLQYVPYSFAKNGVPWQFALTLRRLAGLASFEIMFHELWLRHRPVTDLKGRAIGAAQRLVTLQMIKMLQPLVIHTHIPINRDALIARGLAVSPLPLFANIGHVQDATASGTEKGPSTYRVAFFSRLESPPPVQSALQAIEKWCTQSSLRLEVALLGGGKARVTAAAETIQEAVPSAIVLPVGYLSAEGVSAWLATCDVALTPIPRHSLGKSGTVAAFLEHGLPVIAPINRVDQDPFFRTELNRLVMDTFDPMHTREAKSGFANGKIELENLERTTNRFMTDLSLTGSSVGDPERIPSNS